jgi:hypothetical protein
MTRGDALCYCPIAVALRRNARRGPPGGNHYSKRGPTPVVRGSKGACANGARSNLPRGTFGGEDGGPANSSRPVFAVLPPQALPRLPQARGRLLAHQRPALAFWKWTGPIISNRAPKCRIRLSYSAYSTSRAASLDWKSTTLSVTEILAYFAARAGGLTGPQAASSARRQPQNSARRLPQN